jgi:hypothetical protein
MNLAVNFFEILGELKPKQIENIFKTIGKSKYSKHLPTSLADEKGQLFSIFRLKFKFCHYFLSKFLYYKCFFALFGSKEGLLKKFLLQSHQ